MRSFGRTCAAVYLLALAICLPAESQNTTLQNQNVYAPRALGFQVRVNDLEINHEIAALFLLPDQEVTLKAFNDNEELPITCQASSGVLNDSSPSHCIWRAPSAKGDFVITVRSTSPKFLTLNVFVMEPFHSLQDGKVNGYKIGSYPLTEHVSLDRLDKYQLPKGFIEVTPQNENTLISPHFSLGQFVCKGDKTYPKYIVLQEPLILKLERILEEINRLGIETDTLYVMSGYRTPAYNHAIENVTLSRHIFGDAADIFIPHANKLQYRLLGPSEVLSIFKIVNQLEQISSFQKFIGGMGLYSATSSHPSFVHVDVRGFPARW